MTQFKGRIGDTISDSLPWWPDSINHKSTKPNIVVVVLDDTGWADFGCFGSEIETPTIDALAARGLRYSNFHVTPLCSPTRACLLTGKNHHSVGMRFLADVDTGFPNARGALDPGVAVLPSLLKAKGYGTYMVGKWHLTPAHEILPSGPFHNWPLAKGFERFYGFLPGCTGQLMPELCEDNHQIDRDYPDGYHLSEDLIDRAISYVRDHTVFRDQEPFYLQLAFGATHAPFQVPRDYVDKYVDVFQKGWDQTRDDRLRRQKELGVAPHDAELAPRNPEVRPWTQLSDDEKRLFSNQQAAYAGFLEHTDEHLGRLVAELERLGELDNTVIIVMSDNGASREGGDFGAVDTNSNYSGTPESVIEQLAKLDAIGSLYGGSHYPLGWAMAGNTPFRKYKQHVELGGVRSPMVVSWPDGISARGEVREQFSHVIDLAPTILELAGLSDDVGMDGRSIRTTFAGGMVSAPRSVQYWENLGHRAIWMDGWRAVTEHRQGEAYEADHWRLYDTRSDFSEKDDVADREPERLKGMVETWWLEARKNGVLPLDDRTLVELLGARTPVGLISRKRLVFRPAQSHLPVSSMIVGTDRSMTVTAEFVGRKAGEEGVLVASGDGHGGYVLYVYNDALHFEHAHLGQRVRCVSETLLPEGSFLAGFTISDRSGSAATLTLFQDGVAVQSTRIPVTAEHPSFWGLDVGRDMADRVSVNYPEWFPYASSSFARLIVEFLDDLDPEAVAEAMERTE